MGLRLPEAGTIEIAPSILSADFAKLADEIAEVEAAGVKMIHLDVMDGHFVPNITIGPAVISRIRKCSDLFFDSHLMISDPEKYAKQFVESGVNHITFHIEVSSQPERLIQKVHDMDCSVGICLNPETPVDKIEKFASMCDMILVMTVPPGFGAQKFREDAAKKIVRIREIVGPDVRIEVDGGISPDNAGLVVSYGADTLVAGNAIFSKSDRGAAIRAIYEACE